MIRIEIGRRHRLLHLRLPHPVRMARLSEASRAKVRHAAAVLAVAARRNATAVR